MKKIELFSNNSPTIVSFQLTARMVQRYVIGFTHARDSGSIITRHTQHIFCTLTKGHSKHFLAKMHKFYPNALNFALHVNWKLLQKLRSFDKRIGLIHSQIRGLKDSILGNFE